MHGPNIPGFNAEKKCSMRLLPAAALFLPVILRVQASWIEVCRQCNLDGLQSFGMDLLYYKSFDDESCLTFCLASPSVSFAKKTEVMKWLLEEGIPVDNETFHHICRDAAGLRSQDPENWEHFPLALLAHLQEDSLFTQSFDYAEALCHAAFHGLPRTVKILLDRVAEVNFEKILPEVMWVSESDSEASRQDIRYIPTTPLVQAILGGSLAVVGVLLAAGWSGMESQAGLSPVYLAIKMEAKEIAVLLVKIGAVYDSELLAQASLGMQRAVKEAAEYHSRLQSDATTRIKLYSEQESVFEELPLATQRLIKEQLTTLGYTQLEINAVLYSHHTHHF